MTKIRIRLGRCQPTVDRPAIVGQQLVVAYGMGTDSTAMLILLRDRGIRPDAILFADTGSERAHTYAYLQTINAWLDRQGFPRVTVVSIKSKHASLAEKNITNETLPFTSFGGNHTCSIGWKIDAQEKFLNNNQAAAIGWAEGLPVVKLIGYDNSASDCNRRAKADRIEHDPKYVELYPLQDAGMNRDDCKALIEKEGLPQPGKSACFHCPSMKRAEILDLAEREPRLMASALKLEARAEAGKHGFGTCKGLGISFNWREYLESVSPALLARLELEHDCGQDRLEMIRQIRAKKKAG